MTTMRRRRKSLAGQSNKLFLIADGLKQQSAVLACRAEQLRGAVRLIRGKVQKII